MPAPPEGGEPERIIEPGFNPSWSWDGKRIVFERSNEIWISDAAGTGGERVAGIDLPHFPLSDCYPALSPDGSTIAMFKPEEGPKGRYWLAFVGGEAARPLTDQIGYGGPSAWWAPRGDSIVFPSDRAGTSTLWRIPVGGGAPEPITTGSGEDGEPEISRDGRKLIFTNSRQTDVLRVLDVKTGQGREIWRTRYRMVAPVFSSRRREDRFLQRFRRPGAHLHHRERWQEPSQPPSPRSRDTRTSCRGGPGMGNRSTSIRTVQRGPSARFSSMGVRASSSSPAGFGRPIMERAWILEAREWPIRPWKVPGPRLPFFGI